MARVQIQPGAWTNIGVLGAETIFEVSGADTEFFIGSTAGIAAEDGVRVKAGDRITLPGGLNVSAHNIGSGVSQVSYVVLSPSVTAGVPPVSPVGDAFNRARSSELVTLFDSQMQYDEQPLLWAEKTAGSGASTHVPNEATVDLDVTTASGDSVIRQTYEYFRYQPGKSQLIMATGVFGAAVANCTKLIGYGDASNGVFVGQDGGGMFALLRSNITGTPSDARKVYQADWNLDPMDGTGPSGATLDPTKSQIVLIDMEWLGVGTVMVGLGVRVASES